MLVLVLEFYQRKESFWELKRELFQNFLIHVKVKKRFIELASKSNRFYNILSHLLEI